MTDPTAAETRDEPQRSLTLPFAPDHPIASTFEGERSEARRAINDRPQTGPLPTWSLMLSVVLKQGRWLLGKPGSPLLNPDLVVKTRNVKSPVPITTKITKVAIPMRPERLIPDMTEDEVKGTVPGEWVDVHPHRDTSKPAERVVLYLHGGAYVTGSAATHRTMLWRLAKHAHARILAIDYRLAPETTFPAAVFDALCAYLYLIDPPAGQPKYEPHQISFGGDSAGGGLATALLLYCRDHDIPMPGAVATLSPWMDVSLSMPAWAINGPYDYLPNFLDDIKGLSETRSFFYIKTNDDLSHPYISPINAVEDPAKPLPPMLIQVGDAERIRDDGIVFSECKFPNSPIRVELYEDRPHVFQLMAVFDSFSRHGIERLGGFIREQTGTKIDGRPVVEHKAVRILAKPGYPEQEVPDVLGIVHDAARKLIERGEWKHDLEDTSFFIVKKNATIRRRVKTALAAAEPKSFGNVVVAAMAAAAAQADAAAEVVAATQAAADEIADTEAAIVAVTKPTEAEAETKPAETEAETKPAETAAVAAVVQVAVTEADAANELVDAEAETEIKPAVTEIQAKIAEVEAKVASAEAKVAAEAEGKPAAAAE
ncbi:hypothetical protein HK105_207797 [Polyrhizophydium stewartii]|uniref:Alpha/beta hydrolase fold-3 domain-containing protein n=1 Tax=Polyrhizophydium stewartii TaxID=2732419 RepID=A0ABR4MZM7_9FUNG